MEVKKLNGAIVSTDINKESGVFIVKSKPTGKWVHIPPTNEGVKLNIIA